MIKRFQGDSGKKLLLNVLQKQSVLRGDVSIIEEVVSLIELIQVEPNDVLIEQGEVDNDLFFILTGRMSVRVNNREVAIREVGEHIGELAAINPSAPRSATIIATQSTVVAKITESNFSFLANKYPIIWRNIAVELGERLGQRNRMVLTPNPRPVLFVGSSVESLKIAREIQSGLRYDDILVRVWTDKVFGASSYPIEDLEKQLSSSDFALLVLGPDDKVFSRGVDSDAPRDNVVLELGLFMGALSRMRTFLLKPDKIELKIPTDLLGLNPLVYKIGTDDDLPALLAPVCDDLRKLIQKMGPK